MAYYFEGRTPHKRNILEKLIVAQLVKASLFVTVYGSKKAY
jgi:hypothetical protein